METNRDSMVETDMKPLMRNTAAVMLLLSMFTIANGQEADSLKPIDTTGPDSGDVLVGDSMIELSSFQAVSELTVNNCGSPTGALLRSMVFPGWGQLCNRKYIKSLVVMAGEGYCIVQAIRHWDLANQAYDRFVQTDDSDSRKSLYYYDYDYYQDRRNLFLWLSGVAIFLSMIDAYVDAHLANFDIDITPPFEEPGEEVVGVKVTYRF
jgi:hypothetical protein